MLNMTKKTTIEEHIIYQSDFFNSTDTDEGMKEGYKEFLEINDMDKSEYDYDEYLNDQDSQWLYDEQMNLDKPLDNNIIAIADLGLWNGRRTGYKELGRNLSDVLDNFDCDYIKIYFDGKDIRSTGVHHDGRNQYIFRELRTDRDSERFMELLYDGKIDINNRKQLGAWTKPLDQVKAIYGW